MTTDQHRQLLDRASRASLPDQVDENSDCSVDVLRELIEAGCMEAIDASTLDGRAYLNPRVTLAGREYLNRLNEERTQPVEELIDGLQRMRDIMVDVSTGGRRIDDVNSDYRDLYVRTSRGLAELGLKNPNTFPDLWDWYGRWSSGDLPSYQSRRQFLAELFNPLLEQARDVGAGIAPRVDESTGWPKVDRTVSEIRRRLAESKAEEQFQVVGLLCREVLISLAQAVHDPAKHTPLDEVTASETDAKRLLESYIAVELGGSAHETARKHARSAYDLAVSLQHRRTATFRDAALCAEATSSVINVIAIVSSRRDPSEL